MTEEMMGSMSPELKRIIEEVGALEDEKSVLSAREKEINKRLDDLGRSAYNMFEVDGFPVFIMGGRKISLSLKNCWCVHDKAQLIEQLENDPNTAGFVKKDFSKRSLDKFLDEALLADGRIPLSEDVIDLGYVKPLIQIRRV